MVPTQLIEVTLEEGSTNRTWWVFRGMGKDTKLDCDRNALDPGVTGEGHMYDLGVKTLRELSEN